MEKLTLRKSVQKALEGDGSADYVEFVLVPMRRGRLRLVEIKPIFFESAVENGQKPEVLKKETGIIIY